MVANDFFSRARKAVCIYLRLLRLNVNIICSIYVFAFSVTNRLLQPLHANEIAIFSTVLVIVL